MKQQSKNDYSAFNWTDEMVNEMDMQEDANTYLHAFESRLPTEKIQELIDTCPEEDSKVVKKRR